MEEQLMHGRRRAMLGVFFVMIPLVAENLLAGGAQAMPLIVLKATWGMVLLSAALLLPRATPRARRWLMGLVAFTSATALSLVAWLRADPHSWFIWLLIVPFVLLVLTQGDVAAEATGAVTTLAVGTAILVWIGAAWPEALKQVVLLGASAALAVYTSVRQGARRSKEWALHRERLEAVDNLAASEKLRAQAEKMALVGQLAAGVAHEINNPLAFVSANLAFIEAELATGPSEVRTVLEETRVGFKRIAAIVADLTAFSREGVEETAAIDLRAIVAEAQRMASMRTRDKVRVVNQLAEDLPRVVANGRHLIQVFLNLILNAADELGAAATPDGTIWVHASSAMGRMRIDVDDNGPGVPEVLRASLFTPFFTTKPVGRGTGLGLATSREYLRRGGGELEASMRPGGGARFTLTLPLAAIAP